MGKKQIGGPVAIAIIVIAVIIVVGIGLYTVNRPQNITSALTQRAAAYKQQMQLHANTPASTSPVGSQGNGMPTQGH